jgi:hypothetical protein
MAKEVGRNNLKRTYRSFGDGAAPGGQYFLLRFALCLARLVLLLRQGQVAIP